MTGPLPPSGPPAPPASPTAAPAPVPIAEVLLATLPDKLQNLQRPVLLPGTVAGQTPEGLVQVRTQAGDVLIRIAIPLQTNQSILLQILAGTPPT
ncbi:MAG TPA: hypothetical protein VEB64_07525, partial [Azospirillaceae bacterium]|nr:hypothetical protein [Azospirillaceae bacterium]